MADMTIQQRMVAVMQEIGFIAKERKAPQQIGGYAFRGIDDFYQAVQPALIKCGVVVIPEVLEIIREERTTKNGGVSITTLLKIAYHFHGEAGDYITAVVVGEGSDGTDKGANKAMSSAFKYLCSQAWCIPTDDPELDTEATAPAEIAPQQKAPAKPKEQPAKAEDKGMEWFATLKETLQNMCDRENAQAVCESILLLDKLDSQLPEDKPTVPHTLLKILGKRGVKVGKAGPVGLTEQVGKDVLSLFAKYTTTADPT